MHPENAIDNGDFIKILVYKFILGAEGFGLQRKNITSYSNGFTEAGRSEKEKASGWGCILRGRFWRKKGAISRQAGRRMGARSLCFTLRRGVYLLVHERVSYS